MTPPIDFKKNKITSPVGVQIGNFVFNQHGKIVPFTIGNFSIFHHPKMNGDYGFYAIPLIETFFLLSGFKKSGDGFMAITKNGWHFHIWKTDSGWIFREYQGCVFKHLHQLQNLYFLLTGEELQINF